MFKLCPYCQRQVPVYEWAAHEMQHRGPVHPATMARSHSSPPSPQIQQAAAKAPRIYHHPRCGHATALSDEAVYAQLQDPFRSSDQAYCSGCKGYVATTELFWEGSSESLLSTDRRRKAEHIRTHALNPNDFVWDSTGPVRRKTPANWGVIAAVGVAGGMALVLLLGVGLAITLAISSRRNAAARNNRVAPAVPVVAPLGQPPVVNQPFGQPNGIGEMRIRQDDLFEQMRKRQEEAQKQHEKMLSDLQERLRTDIPQPPDFTPPGFPDAGIPGFPGGDPGADARKRMDEIQQESQRRLDEMRKRSRERQEEMRQRMEERRSQFP